MRWLFYVLRPYLRAYIVEDDLEGTPYNYEARSLIHARPRWVLPAAKVTEEITQTRQIPAHQDCLSPRGHSAFSTPIEMLEFAAKMRELSGGKPIGLKLCVGPPHEVFAIMKTGIYPAFIVVDGVGC
ncbi:MAG: glutamate synthase-related protein [Halomonas sp.]|nr:glutamate synthase-related protein [Halomonas sp.]MDN6296392.1 glutamate synthase-related protein [Halomonas sp.]MDN6313745.1 glutamate synthase-related protein [Halomonas sp.]MDN6335199.1 glutamate synthase-related protein [Halomonas sp.]